MIRVKYFALCVILLFLWQHIDAAKLTKSRGKKIHDEELKTYIYESPVDDDIQSDATTIYPPLIEEPSKPTDWPEIVSVETHPSKHPTENEVIHSPESTISDVPVQQYAYPYANNPFYYNPYMYQGYSSYPFPYVPQQQQPYYTQPNMGQQPFYEGVLVPVQTSVQPTHSQLSSTQTSSSSSPPPPPSSLQATQTRLEVSSSPSPPQSIGAATTNTGNSNEHKIPTSIKNQNSFDLALLLRAVLPQNIIQLIIAVGNFILNSFSTLAFAGAITSLLCSLTTVCTMSFGAFPFGVRKILIDGAEISTIQRVRRAAEMVTNALDKYEKLQKGVESLTNSFKQAQKQS